MEPKVQADHAFIGRKKKMMTMIGWALHLLGVRWLAAIVRRLWEVKLHGMLLPVLMWMSGVSALKLRWVRFHCHVHVAFLSVLVFVVLVHLATLVLQKRR